MHSADTVPQLSDASHAFRFLYEAGRRGHMLHRACGKVGRDESGRASRGDTYKEPGRDIAQEGGYPWH